MKKINRLIDHDLFASMIPSFIGTHLLDDIITFFVDTYIAVILGQFTNAIISHDVDYLKSNIYLFIGCLCFKIIFEPLIFAFFSSKSVYGSSAFVRKLLLHYLRKPYTEVSTNQGGDIPSRIDNDMMDFVRTKLMQTGNRIMIILFSVYFIWIARSYYLPYVVVALIATAVAYIAPILSKQVFARYDAKERTYQSEKNTTETELATHAGTLHGIHLHNQLIEKIDDLFIHYYHELFLKKERLQVLTATFSNFFQHSAQLIIIIVGAFFLNQKKISYGDIATMLSLTASMTSLYDRIINLITVKPILRNLYERLQFFYGAEQEIDAETTNNPSVPIVYNSDNIIVGEGLSLQYGDCVLFDQFSFSIPRGKITVLKGGNGCGKSTLLRMICGFEIPDSGKLWFDGQEISAQDRKSSKISLCAQDSTIFRYISPKENAELGSYACEALKDAEQWMSAFSMTEIENLPMSDSLSGGEAQKVKLIRALLMDAELLILDEPENHLDAEGIKKLIEILSMDHKSVLIVSHLSSFDEVADQTIVLSN